MPRTQVLAPDGVEAAERVVQPLPRYQPPRLQALLQRRARRRQRARGAREVVAHVGGGGEAAHVRHQGAAGGLPGEGCGRTVWVITGVKPKGSAPSKLRAGLEALGRDHPLGPARPGRARRPARVHDRKVRQRGPHPKRSAEMQLQYMTPP
jgi:hypothetical protein